jgi:hypothetical protein
MEAGDSLTRWTVRLALALYAIAIALRLTANGRSQRFRISRLTWSGGCIAFLLHVAVAFHFFHAWRHDAAYDATAKQTADVVGWDWGGGLYLNYLFALVWLIDVAWWWIDAPGYLARARWIDWCVYGFMTFIAFNSTVFFAAGAIRWFGLAATLFLGGLWFGTGRARWRDRIAATFPPSPGAQSPTR